MSHTVMRFLTQLKNWNSQRVSRPSSETTTALGILLFDNREKQKNKKRGTLHENDEKTRKT